MQSNKGFIGLGAVIVIVFALIVVGGGAYYIGHQNTAPSTQPNYPDLSTTQQIQQTSSTSVQATTSSPATTPIPAPKPVQTQTPSTGSAAQNTNTKTYTNSQYGFSFQYSNNFTIGSYGDCEGWGCPPSAPSEPTPVAVLKWTGKQPDTLNGSVVAVQVSNSVSYEDCTRLLAQSKYVDATKTLTVNGHTFYKDVYGMMKRDFRTYFNGQCFEITSNTEQTRFKSATGLDVAPITNAVLALVNSFTFTIPESAAAVHSTQTTPPAWSTYNGSQLPFTFQYPGVLSDNSSKSNAGNVQLNQPDQTVGLKAVTSFYLPGEILIWDSQGSTLDEIQKASANPIVSWTQTTIGGEVAIQEHFTNDSSSDTFYVAHNGHVYGININSPLPSETQTLTNSFHFTQ